MLRIGTFFSGIKLKIKIDTDWAALRRLRQVWVSHPLGSHVGGSVNRSPIRVLGIGVL
jgi:hypothetical protein